MLSARFRTLLAICGCVSQLGVSTLAQADDSRLVTRHYDEGEVVRIDGKIGVQATIGFGEGEHIENVAVGDSEKWQIAPNKRTDLLFVKPLDATARTNMTVVTDKHTYFFDLIASPTANPIYMMRFTYGAVPAEPAVPAPVQLAAAPVQAPAATAPPPVTVPVTAPAQVAVAEAPPEATAIESGEKERSEPEKKQRKKKQPALTEAASREPTSVPLAAMVEPGAGAIDPAMLNFAWQMRGSERVMPARIYDDGSATYLLWGVQQDVPSILLLDSKGAEYPAEFAIRGNTIVLPGVPKMIVLRNGKASGSLENLREMSPAMAAKAPAKSDGAAALDN